MSTDHTDKSTTLPLGEYLGSVTHRATTSDVTLIDTRYAAGTRLPLHRHAAPTFFFMLEGAFVDPAGARSCWAGAATYHPAEQLHGRGEFLGGPARAFNVELGPKWHPYCPEHSSPVTDSEIPWLLSRLYREHRALDSAHQLAIHGIVWELVAELNRVHERSTRGMATNRLVARAGQILRDSLPSVPEWDALAFTLGIEPIHLARAFRVRYGCGPAVYVRRRRLELAAHQLAASRRPIADIAAAAGFYDQAHFTRAFKSSSGLTPAAYRRLMRSGSARD